MKFPLSAKPFAPVELSEAEMQDLIKLGDAFVAGTLEYYEAHAFERKGVVDRKHWKCIKQRENVSVYQDREAQTTAPPGSKAKKLQVLVACGSIAGDLDELMYGVVNATTEDMMIKTSYVQDNVVDCQVLASIVKPTPEDPTRTMQLKWSVNGCPRIIRQLIRARDFVYLEYTGMTRSSSGERLGFHIIHSIAIPGVRELQEHGLVRGELSLHHFFRQKSADQVEVYVRGFCDPMGEMYPSLATLSCADGTVAIWKTMVCSRKKKLAWLLRHRRGTVITTPQDTCAVCGKKFVGAIKSKKRCQVCQSQVCSSCWVSEKLSFLPPAGNAVVQQSVRFCARCLVEANRLQAVKEVAVSELMSETASHMHHTSLVNSDQSLPSPDHFPCQGSDPGSVLSSGCGGTSSLLSRSDETDGF